MYLAAATALLMLVGSPGNACLSEQFAEPPHEAKPGMMWYWIRGNVTEEGIDADLEAMAESGIRVVHLMHIGETFTAPVPVTFLSPEYERLLRHTFKRARELGLVINLYNCEGFSSAGGPWMPPEESMQRLVWTETQVRGGSAEPIVLPPPYRLLDYHRDEAVVAFPLPAAEQVGMVYDFLWRGAAEDHVGWIHRQADGADIYFVANHGLRDAAGTASFRVTDRVPELWNPQTGERFRAAEFTRNGAHTEIPLHLKPVQSVFVVFPPQPTV